MEEETMTQQASITDRLNKVINHIAHDGTINISDCKYDEIRNFMYLWNLFEKEFFKSGSKYQLPNALKQNNLSIDQIVIDETFKHFQDRYQDTIKLKKLRLSPENEKQVYDTLTKAYISADERRQTIITIIYRYRCNLFHGSKEIASLWNQEDNFTHANQFMLACLEAKLNIN